jgi:ABC-type nitrate/sulfonate/bicarbonate transport system substrate-binding protein
MGSGPLRRAARLLGAAGLVLLARCAPGAGLVVAAGLVLIVACAPASVQPAAPAQPAAPGQADASGQPAAGQPAPAAPASMAPPAVAQVTYGIAARSFSYLPSVVAERQGFYRQRGIEVQIQLMTPVQIAAGQIADQVQYGTGYLQAVRAGGPLRIVSAQITGPIFTVMARPGIGAVADLRGKTMGTGSRGAALERTTVRILDYFGLAADRDVALLPFPEVSVLMQAFVQGQVDAAALSPPWLTRARQAGMVRLLAAADVDPEPQNGLVVTPARLAQHRDQVRDMVLAEIEAFRFIHDQRAETEAIVREWLAVSPEEAAEGYEAALPLISRDGQLNRAGIQSLIASEQASGLAPAELTVDTLIDPTLAAEALRALDAERSR